jgi:hypothetical protein
MSEMGPSSEQIVAEWIMTDPVGDSDRWREGIRRYEAGTLDDVVAMGAAAELMCVALAYYVADGTVVGDMEDESPEEVVAQTIWNVLVAILHGSGGKPLSVGSAKCLRLALAAVRRSGYQAEDLGGNGLMAEAFDDGSRALMAAALSGLPARVDEAPVQLTPWFTGQPVPESTQPDAVSPGEGLASEGSRWGALRKRAQQAQQHVNSLALQHGIEAIQGALTEAQIAKTDEAGKLKIRKIGAAKAVVRPSKTLRRAVGGAALTEHLKAYNQQVYGTGVDSQETADPQLGRNQSCGECGTELTPNASFCASCGKPVAMIARPEEPSIQYNYIQPGASGDAKLQEFDVKYVTFYDGTGHRLGPAECTLTSRRLIINDVKGGIHQILLRDISGITTPSKLAAPKMLRISLPGQAYDIDCSSKDQKKAIEAWLGRAIRDSFS